MVRSIAGLSFWVHAELKPRRSGSEANPGADCLPIQSARPVLRLLRPATCSLQREYDGENVLCSLLPDCYAVTGHEGQTA